ncbi:MAG: GxxExxY protein [Anaerolineae bacterium]|nr:GxxExxY protein [Anaerolineae bacterium]
MDKLLFKDETYAIIGAAMEVHKQLGAGFLEAVYQEALALEFKLRTLPFVEQQTLEIVYKGHALRQRYIPDFIVYEQIIVEIKAIKKLGANEEAQLLNYLKATGLRIGLLLNFGAPSLEWNRKIL